MDTDMVLYLHRPCEYEPGLNLSHYEQYTEDWAGKVREGKAGGMVPLCFTGRYATFSDWPEGWQRPALEQDPEGEQAWAARLARNARSATAGRVTIHLLGVPEGFGTSLGRAPA